MPNIGYQKCNYNTSYYERDRDLGLGWILRRCNNTFRSWYASITKVDLQETKQNALLLCELCNQFDHLNTVL